MIPTACTRCRRSFGEQKSGASLALLEGDFALCDSCEWLIDHPEVGPNKPGANVSLMAPFSID